MGASAIETLGLVPARNVTLGFLVMYACFFTLQAGTKFYLLARAKRLAKQRGDKSPSFAQIKYGGSKHHGGSRLGLTFDRAVGNTIEQALVFLPLLWIASLSVVGEAKQADVAWWGWAWIAFRAIYPLCFHQGPPLLFVSTVPGYAICLRLFAYAM